MPFNNGQICPWCDSEIVWDPEIGPEDVCPHCSNELTEYRSLNISVERQGRSADRERPDLGSEPSPEDTDDLAPDSDDLYEYEQAVEYLLERQDDVCECDHCREDMLLLGIQSAEPSRFRPASHEGLAEPLLQAPYSYKVFVCPSCFRLDYALGDDERTKLAQQLKLLRNKFPIK